MIPRYSLRASRQLVQARHFHASPRQHQANAVLSSRWLADLKAEAKQRSESGSQAQKDAATNVLQRVERDWLALLAGSEGFLTASNLRGLDNYPVAWGEMDTMGETLSQRPGTMTTIMLTRLYLGHINNIVYNRWAESSRVNWLGNMSRETKQENKKAWGDLMSPRSVGLIMKSIKTDYKMPIVYPDSITVLHKLVKRPTLESTSLDLEAVIISHRHTRPAARCFEDIVVYDYRKGSKTTMPPFMVEELGVYFDKQEEARRTMTKQISDMQKSLA